MRRKTTAGDRETHVLEVARPDGTLEPLSDVELTELALAADPDSEVGDGALSLRDMLGHEAEGLLAEWYMPVPMIGRRSFSGWRRWSAGLVIVAFLVITASGLCSTYGRLALL